ncbi:hypothetical protein FQN54_002545 [Arachnomyces sp. PD_36]|nr:hypothetical protein FQN54_002545 [Arachnomyces sp. PD_36]
MAAAKHLKSLTTIFLDQPPSCLEFCPTAPDYFVVGTYLLTEVESTSGHQTKTGTLKLFKLDPSSFELENVQSIELSHAVFDLHFSPNNGSIFGIATSAGTFELYSIDTSNGTPVIALKSTIRVHNDPGVPALYFDWAPKALTARRDCETLAFAVSFSDGTVSIFYTNPPEYTISEDSLSKVSFSGSLSEIWDVKLTASSDEAPVLYFGDDFSTLRTIEFDADGELTDEEFPNKIKEFSDKGKLHGAGVTAILPLFNERGGTTLLTGSYDEYIRVYRYQGRGTVLAEKCLGGGVWRLKLLDTETASSTGDICYLVLASCMHAGARILRIRRRLSDPEDVEGFWSIEVLAEFSEHESMNYASDMWRGGGGPESGMLCVSSSFYDKRLCVWKL